MHRAAWELIRGAAARWYEDNISRHASSLAFYTALSIAPLLVIAIAVAGMAFGEEAATHEVSRQLRDLLGPAAADTVEEAVRNAAARESNGILASALGIALLVWAATNVFASLQDSLNTVWGVKPRPDVGIVNTVRIRFLSFTLVLAIAFLLLVSLLASAAISALNRVFSGGAAEELAWRAANLGVSVVVFTAVFAMIFKVLPDVRVQWRDVWVGAALTAALFAAGKSLIGLYLGHSSAASIYGAAGSMVVLLLWVYYSSQILFFGAEFTQVYAARYGRRIVPDSHAVAVSEEARAREGIPHRDTVEQATREHDRRERDRRGALGGRT